MSEPLATRLKRLKMRSMRRGIKEMDIIDGELKPIAFEGVINARIVDHSIFKATPNINEIRMLHMNGRDLAHLT